MLLKIACLTAKYMLVISTEIVIQTGKEEKVNTQNVEERNDCCNLCNVESVW